ncbi:retention module-containing protein [Kluyvera intermedia]|uniref:Retention module-containing protein n=1 Tax=Kluyvera intermedia TaxID=61648 RepID=A0AA95JZ99_KLUIN|nr:retention module-containing protein [Kluyvera intermedia]WGL54846.1 retention module-containing protein [Kluyvera intermedia]
MSTIIGTIKAVMGQVWIVASDGSRRLATEGEQIMRGELVVTDQGAATVTLPNGKNMDLGRGSEWGDGAVAASASGGADEQAIAAAQQAIAEGADPTQILEATAAGNSTIIDSFAEPTGAHNGHSHVILDLTGEILDPTAGYPTQGLDAATIAPVEEVTLLRPELDNSSDDPITPPPPQPLPEASITIDVIAGDNVINMNEAAQEKTVISGTTGLDVHPGDIVTVTVNGNSYQTQVAADGRWSVEVNTHDLVASGEVHASVTTFDQYGNQASASAESAESAVALDITAPNVSLHIDVISGDGFINTAEAAKPTTTISGTVGGDAKAGDVVHLEVNGTDYIAQVVAGEGGKLVWQTEVATSDLLAEPQVNGSITIRDAAGNEATAVDSESVVIDTTAPAVTLHIDVISDGYINANESKESTTTVKGIVGGDAKAGDIVHLEVNGTNYTATVVAGEGSALVWQTEVATSDLLADPIVNGSITIKDAAGNEATAIDDESVVIDTTAPVVTLHIDVISGDGYINAVESKELTTTVKGTVGGDAKAGDIVHLEVNGTDYTAQVVAGEGGKLVWQTEVATRDLLADPQVNGSITIRDATGNEATAVDSESVVIDTTAPVVTLHIDVISDGYINANESKESTTTVKGIVGGDAKAGDIVHLEVNGTNYTATVVAGEGSALVWQTEVATSDLLADPIVNGSITIKDAAGNEATAIDDESVVIDTTAPVVTLHIDVISGDGYINAVESKEPTTTVKGTVGGDAKAGDIVHLEVNGTDYSAQVVAGDNGTLIWQTEVATSDLLADPDVNGSITIKDAAGNEATAIDDESVEIDTTAPVVTLHIDVISDGYINAAESKEPTTIVKGTVGGDAKAGDVVHLEVNGADYTAQVVAGENSTLVWQTEVATSDLLADPEVNGSITIKDAAGNEATAIDDESVIIDTTAPVVTLHIDVISDGYINAAEAEKPTTNISGTVGGDAKAGDVVHLEINGKDYPATVVAGEDGALVWQTKVATSDLLADPIVNGTITIKDAAGNEATAIDDETVVIDTTAPVVTLHIDVISGDGFINTDEATKPTTTISGTVGGDAKAGDVVHLEVNEKAYTAEVYADKDGKLIWQTEVTTSDLINDPQVNGTITIRDEAGNTATATDDESVKIDTTPPVVTLEIDTISDGYINAAESKEPTTTVKGTVGGDAKAGDVVHLEVNDKAYTAEVYADKDGKLVWQTEVTTSDLINDPQVNGTITITDEAGNTATATDDESVKIDTTPPVVTLEIDTISGDGFINADEAAKPTTTISGTVGGDAKAGDVVHLEVNGNKYTAEVYADKDGKLVWQTEVTTSDLIYDPQVNGTITIRDEAGNTATATDDESVKIDTTPPVVTLEIDTISDGYINAAESKEPTTTVKGTVGGDAKAGDVVHLEVNGNGYTTEVYTDKDGKLVWQTEVATSDLLANQQVNGAITITDEAGNEATATDDETVTIDTTPPVVELKIDIISGDGFINAAESKEPTTTVKGTVGGDAKAGDVVHLEINGKDYPATWLPVKAAHWSGRPRWRPATCSLTRRFTALSPSQTRPETKPPPLMMRRSLSIPRSTSQSPSTR